jgi:hypothetical protein
MTEKPKTTLPLDSAGRKEVPLASGPLRYFPAALAGVARVCKVGNDKHNGVGTPLRHSRGKSMDHEDCILRHMVDLEENDGYEYVLGPDGEVLRDEAGVPLKGMPQAFYVAWRALALAQEWAEKHLGAPPAPAATFGEHAAVALDEPYPSPRPYAQPGARSRG